MIAQITKSLSIGSALALGFGALPKPADSQDYPFPRVVRPAYPQAYQPQVTYVAPADYQTVRPQVPVTTYLPILSIDPSTGCQVAYVQPVTTMERQVQAQPYTTYRPVFSRYESPPSGSTPVPVPKPEPTYYATAATSTTSPPRYTIVTSSDRVILVDNGTESWYELLNGTWQSRGTLPGGKNSGVNRTPSGSFVP
jgi:hypothetical protein